MVAGGANPYIVPADAYSSIFSPRLRWFQTSAYGPVCQILFVLADLLSPYGRLASVYFFKLFCLVFHVISSLLILSQAREKPRGMLIFHSYLANPILIFEYVKQAHVDAELNLIVVAFSSSYYFVREVPFQLHVSYGRWPFQNSARPLDPSFMG